MKNEKENEKGEEEEVKKKKNIIMDEVNKCISPKIYAVSVAT
jgi:hypothetical protein